jgi:putative Holliday junction resolvase
MRSLGLDIGDRRIGVALSDPEGWLASPLTIINRSDTTTDIKAITDIVDQNHVGQIIVGLPLSMNGGLGQQADKVQEFTKELISRTDIPVDFRDERLTTVSAQRLMRAAGSSKNKRKTPDDAIAATLILQGYLDETR